MDITAANAVLTLTIVPLFTVPQQLQQFAADDVYDLEQVQSVEVLMGVDGKMSGGFVYKEINQDIILQADSPSNDVFDTWWTSMQATKGLYVANGLIRLPAIGKKFTQVNGQLTGYKLPGAKKLIQPRRYRITWESIAPSPV